MIELASRRKVVIGSVCIQTQPRVEKQIVALGDLAIGVDADVSRVADLERHSVGSAVKAFGRMDIMVNNAGMETRTSVLETTEAQYEKVLAVNLKSAFFGTRACGPPDDQTEQRRPNH